MAMSGWGSFDGATIDREPGGSGVYELGDSTGNVIYIGSAYGVMLRLKAHLRGSEGPCTQSASYFRVDYLQSGHTDEERRRYDEYVRTHNGRRPRCNDKRP